GGAVRAPGGLGGGGRRRARRRHGGGGRRRRRAQGRGGRRGHPPVRQGPRRRLQVPAPDLGPRRAPEGPDGEDPQARDQAAFGVTIVRPSRRPSRTESTRGSAAMRSFSSAIVFAVPSSGSRTVPPRSMLSSSSRPPGFRRGTSAS